MLTVERRERIRRAYYVEGKSMRQIGEELRHSYWTIRGALDEAAVRAYQLRAGKAAPVLGGYKERIAELLQESERQPRKQRYTSHKIYELLQKEGYSGSESGVRRYIGERRRERKRPPVYLPLAFDPGVDGQVDWGEVTVKLNGEESQVELFVMRLCYSRKVFAMVFPTQRQECFFAGHVAAFQHFRGVPKRLSYDNLKTAVQRILEGRNRVEQSAFVTFRSHYLFESRYCTPGQGHEKGSVEHGVGYVRRNFLTPLLSGDSFAALNQQLLDACQADDERCVDRQAQTIGELWAQEQRVFRAVPAAFACCSSHEVTLNPYGQVVFETNRYSVPVERAQKHLVVKAYPFQLEVLAHDQKIATHVRCYGREQDILEPLHYLSLLLERPGAFEHALPLRQWRSQWPPLYEQLLAHLRTTTAAQSTHQAESQAIRHFIQILLLHREQPAALMEQAIAHALQAGIAHVEGITFCLNRLLDPAPLVAALDLRKYPTLANVGTQAVPLTQYNQLLGGDR
jgi:transposase